MKVRESVGRCVKLAVRPWKFATHKNTWDLMKLKKYWKVVQWVKSFRWNTNDWFSHLAFEYVRESIRTWVYGHEESHLMHDMKYSI